MKSNKLPLQDEGLAQLKGLLLIYNHVTKNSELFPSLHNCGGEIKNSRELQECHFSLALELLPEFGAYYGTKTQACVHAAGSALTVYSLGAEIESAGISHNGKGYAGGISFKQLGIVEHPHDFLFREAVGVIGGYGAETYMGIDHGCSSLPNKIIAAAYCAHLEKILRKEQGYFFLRALAYTHSAITTSRHAFNAIVYLLSKKGCLSEEEARDALKTARRIPLILQGQEAA